MPPIGPALLGDHGVADGDLAAAPDRGAQAAAVNEPPKDAGPGQPL
jgi:hypothetical protein